MTAPRWLAELEALEKAAVMPSPYGAAIVVGGGLILDCGERNLWDALRNRLPQILRALRVLVQIREWDAFNPPDGIPKYPYGDAEFWRNTIDAAMADAPDTTATTEKGKA